MSQIEDELYVNQGFHGVTEFTLSRRELRLRLTPWQHPEHTTQATFLDVRELSVEAYPDDPKDMDLPWEILGFDCYPSGEHRWKFVLHCDAIEWCFTSAWPIIARSEASQPEE